MARRADAAIFRVALETGRRSSSSSNGVRAPGNGRQPLDANQERQKPDVRET